jgi:predicted dehydrogenase
VLGVAKIATEKVIPAMQRAERCEVAGIASRDRTKAEAAAQRLGLARAYGSYEALVAAPDIDAIYNALPNHLHVEWTIAAAERGKHVLCEKPIGLTAADARQVIAARDRTGVKIEEAFMVQTHPQWLRALEISRSGRIGRVRSYMGYFSYFNDDASNIRNVEAYGGGGLLDIGCYLTTTSRLVFGEEPARVLGLVERDPMHRIDTLTSMILEFPSGQAIGTCSTRVVPYQRVQIFGTGGRVEIEIPFNAPNDRPCRLWVDDGRDLYGGGREEIALPTCDQYGIQADLFSRAIQENGEVAYSLESSLANMRVLDAIARSAHTGRWARPEG